MGKAEIKAVLSLSARGFLRGLGTAQGAARSALVAINAFAIASTTAWVTTIAQVARLGDNIGKTAKRTGLAVDELQRYRIAAQLSGGSLEGLEKGLKKMASAIYEARRGTLTYVQALTAMGMSAKDFEDLDTGEAFKKMLAGLADVPDEMTRAALAVQLFGRQGPKLLPMLAKGADGLQALKAEADALGVILSADQVQAAENFQDAIIRVRASVQALGNKAVAGALDPLADAMNAFVASGALGKMGDQGERISDAMLSLVLVLADIAGDKDNIESIANALVGLAIAFEMGAKGAMGTLKVLEAIGKFIEDNLPTWNELFAGTPFQSIAIVSDFLGKTNVGRGGAKRGAEEALAGGGAMELRAMRNLGQRGVDVQRSDQGFLALLTDEVRRLREVSEARLPKAEQA